MAKEYEVKKFEAKEYGNKTVYVTVYLLPASKIAFYHGYNGSMSFTSASTSWNEVEEVMAEQWENGFEEVKA